MKSEYFGKVKEKLQLSGIEIGLPSLECLNSISKKALYAFHYSDLSIHCEEAAETVLNWDTIFRRLVIEDFPGCCYERTEVLFQLLEHLQYEVYRLEVRCMRKEMVSPYRHEHVGLAVRLEDQERVLVHFYKNFNVDTEIQSKVVLCRFCMGSKVRRRSN